MKILILGGDGMLGHQMLLSLQHRHEVKVTLRQDRHAYAQYDLFDTSNSYVGIDVCDENDISTVLSDFNPHAVINAVGVVKQRQSAKEAIPSLTINSLFPHRLSQMCESIKARTIHFSTDCIFSGRRGNYTEADVSDAEDLYGRSKFLGEIQDKHCVTLRSSVIGLELSRKASLIEWFLAQKGTIKGFRQAIYSGLTTQEMSRVVEHVLVKCPDLSGVWHVSSHAINKYELLAMFSALLGRKDTKIEPDDHFICDRSLMGETFNRRTGYKAPSWEAMLTELAEQVKTRYGERLFQEMKCSV
jgi:dTDP-4-dehydrorhamnose reductase